MKKFFSCLVLVKIDNPQFYPERKRKRNGFTLVELMVVISIIAILSALAVASFTFIQKTSRDGKRKADLASMQSALEQYHADLNYYPVASSNISPKYLDPLPTPPISGESYSYRPLTSLNAACTTASQCSKYCLYAKLENTTGIINPGLCTEYPSSTNYAVRSP